MTEKIIKEPDGHREAIFSRPYEVKSNVQSWNLEVSYFFIGAFFTGYGIWSEDGARFATSRFVAGKERLPITLPIIIHLTGSSARVLAQPNNEQKGLLIPRQFKGDKIVFELISEFETMLSDYKTIEEVSED